MRKTWGLRVLDRPGNSFHVEYSNRTSVVDMATVGRTLRGVSADHTIFLFEDSPELRDKLVPGNFVLFEGLDLRKVDAYAVDPNTKYLVVGTEKPSLREALKRADVQIKSAVDFDQLFNQLGDGRTASSPSHPSPGFFGSASLLDWLQPTAYADISNTDIEGEVEFSDSNFANWKCHYRFHRSPGLKDKSWWQKPPGKFWDNASSAATGLGLDFEIQLDREAAGLNASITMKGHVTKFELVSSILMADGSLQKASYQNVGLHGTGEIDWQISTSETKTPMNEVRIKLPLKLTIPLIEFTGLPMSLECSAALLFHPAFTTKGEIAKGKFDVNFSGDEGFHLANNEMQVDGKSEGSNAIDGAVAFSPLASFGLVLAAAFPRMELRLGMEELFEVAKIPIPQSVAESLGDLLMKSSLAGQFLKKIGNPLSVEAAGYFQIVYSTTAAHSGMQSLVPCQQFTFQARAQIGFDADLLGTPVAVRAKDLWVQDLVKRDPDVKICNGGS